jgi:iron complex transport system permease protein
VIVISGSSGYGGALVSGRLQELGVPIAAFIGGLGAAALLYVLSWRRGVDGQRFILIGIGLAAMLVALTDWLLTKARIQDAMSAQIWLNGSLNGRGWEHATPLLWTMAVLVPVSLILVRSLNTMQLGDDSASSLGVRLQPVQLLTLVAAVGLAAVAVSAVGPLAFVALVVPQIALRLTGGSRPPMLASMTIGAALVVGADLVTRVVIPFALPAGLVTAALGAPYLIWLLLRTNRKVSA